MKVTEQGLEVRLEDDPVLLAGALNAGAALDKSLVEARFLEPSESGWGKLRFWAQKLEDEFSILDGRIKPSNFADDAVIEKVQIGITADEMLGALAAYGSALLPPTEAPDARTAARLQDKLMQEPDIVAHGSRINEAMAKVMVLQATTDAA